MINSRLLSTVRGLLALVAVVSTQPLTAHAQAAAPIFGVNLVTNGDAEAGTGSDGGEILSDIPGWTREGKFDVILYGASGAASATDPGPSSRGKNYFIGGPSNLSSSASQTIDVSALTSDIAGGKVTFAFSAYVGGYSGQSDHAIVMATFLDKSGKALKSVVLGPVTAQQRNNRTCLLPQAKSGPVPAATQSVVILMKMVRTDGSYNDGSVDNISLVFKK